MTGEPAVAWLVSGILYMQRKQGDYFYSVSVPTPPRVWTIIVMTLPIFTIRYKLLSRHINRVVHYCVPYLFNRVQRFI